MIVERIEPTNTRRWDRDRVWYIASTSAPVILFTFFAYAHASLWIESGELTGLGFALQESVLVALFLMRRRSIESLNTLGAWFVALAGTCGTLLLRPIGDAVFGLDSVYLGIQLLGAALAFASAAFLGRSFGVVAANRGVKTKGVYRIVRHPIYASYIVGLVGYLLASFSLWNAAVIAVTMVFQVKRIHAEESVLMRDPVYRAYADRTKYRLIPGLF